MSPPALTELTIRPDHPGNPTEWFVTVQLAYRTEFEALKAMARYRAAAKEDQT